MHIWTNIWKVRHASLLHLLLGCMRMGSVCNIFVQQKRALIACAVRAVWDIFICFRLNVFFVLFKCVSVATGTPPASSISDLITRRVRILPLQQEVRCLAAEGSTGLGGMTHCKGMNGMYSLSSFCKYTVYLLSLMCCLFSATLYQDLVSSLGSTYLPLYRGHVHVVIYSVA